MAEIKSKTKVKDSAKTYYEGVGRRSEAIARVRAYFVKKGVATINDKEYKAGSFLVNGKDLKVFAAVQSDYNSCMQPITITDSSSRFVVSAKVSGGGKQGQIGAIVLGLARAISENPDADDRAKLKKSGLLTRDARIRERRMVGTGGKSRRLKQSPKR